MSNNSWSFPWTLTARKMDESSPHRSPRKKRNEQFRRNPYKPLQEPSPVKKQVDKSPQKKQLAENSSQKKPNALSPRKTLPNSPRKENSDHSSPKKKPGNDHSSPRKKPDHDHGSPRKKPDNDHGSPRKKPDNDHGSPRKKPDHSPRKKPNPGSIPRIQLEDRDHWSFPSEKIDDSSEIVVKPKKKHRLIQEYDPDVHGAEFERTLVLVKPNAVSKAKWIESVLKRHGLLLLKTRRTHLRPDQARDFYLRSLDEEDNKYYRIYREMVASEGNGDAADLRLGDCQHPVELSTPLPEYVSFVTSGPVHLVIVGGRGAVARCQGLLGPEDPRKARATHPDTIRARLGGETVLRNGVYASSSPVVAEKEVGFFFPDSGATERGVGRGESGRYLSETVNPVLLKGLIQLCRQKPDNPLVWLADWLLANNPNAKT